MQDYISSNPLNNPLIYPDLCYCSLFGITPGTSLYVRDIIHDAYLLLYVNKGKFFLEQYDKSYVLEEGQYLLLDKRFPHTYYFRKDTISEIFWMHISGTQTMDMVNRIQTLQPLPVIGINSQIAQLLEQCISTMRSVDCSLFSVGAGIISALYTVMNDLYDEKLNEGCPPEEAAFRSEFEKIMDFAVDRNQLSQLSLDAICNRMHMNKFYFSHKFKEYYGISPMKYVAALKLEKAKQFLRSTDMKVVTIAQLCGFSSNSYFSNVFRKEFGMTPEQYRSHGS